MGSINQDIFINAKEYPNYGDTVWVDSVNTQPGGKGANQAIALSRIGSQVRFIGAVGNDEQGKNMLKNLTDQKIDTTNIQIKENVNTGTFVVILDEQGENTMLGTVGANNKIKLDPITAIFNSANANYFLLQLETNEDAIMHALKIAKEKNINVILDPAPADGYKEVYLSYANIITPNQQEAEKISGIKITDKETALTAATIINRKGVNTVILKLLFFRNHINFIIYNHRF
jgi:ribokinase